MSVLGRVLGVGINVRYRIVGVVVHAAPADPGVVIVPAGRCRVVRLAARGKRVCDGVRLLHLRRLRLHLRRLRLHLRRLRWRRRRRLTRPVLAPVTRVCDPVERHAVHRPVDHRHQVFERGAQLLEVTGQHGYGVRGQAAPEPDAGTHPVQRKPGTGDVQQQVRVGRRRAGRWWARCHQVGQHAAPAVAERPACARIATLWTKKKKHTKINHLIVATLKLYDIVLLSAVASFKCSVCCAPG